VTDVRDRSGRVHRHRDSPRVRRLAREAGVDLGTVTRTGLHGRATPADVAAAAGAVVPRQDHAHGRSPSPLLSVVEVDLTALTRAPGPLLAFVAEATVRAAGHLFPAAVHLGLSGDGGPRFVRDASDLTVGGLVRRMTDPASRLGSEGAAEDDATGATVTVVDTGDRSVLIGTASVQRGGPVLSLGAVVRRPVVRADRDGHEQLTIRSMAYLALSHDEADLDGPAAGDLLSVVKERLESWRPATAAAAFAESPR